MFDCQTIKIIVLIKISGLQSVSISTVFHDPLGKCIKQVEKRVTSILGKLRLREATCLVQGHRVDERISEN